MSPPVVLTPNSDGYDTVARVFHWGFVVMLLIQLPAGIAITSEAFPTIVDELFILHKGLGSVLLVLVIFRVLWRLIHPVAALLPHMPTQQRRIATLVHGLLYVLLLLMGVSGYVRTVGDNFPIELLDAFGVPPLVSDIPETARIMRTIHAFSAFALTALIAVHVGAVAHQSFIVRETIMSRIWPPFRISKSSRPRGR